MISIAEHLRDVDPLDHFAPEEMNYIIIAVYAMLEAATRDECDVIAFAQNNVTWSERGLPLMQHHQVVPQTVTFRETMRQIIAHDPVVREHFRPVKRDSPIDMDVYEIVASRQSPVASDGAVAGGRRAGGGSSDD